MTMAWAAWAAWADSNYPTHEYCENPREDCDPPGGFLLLNLKLDTPLGIKFKCNIKMGHPKNRCG